MGTKISRHGESFTITIPKQLCGLLQISQNDDKKVYVSVNGKENDDDHKQILIVKIWWCARKKAISLCEENLFDDIGE